MDAQDMIRAIEKQFPIEITLRQDKPIGHLEVKSNAEFNLTFGVYTAGLEQMLKELEAQSDRVFTKEYVLQYFETVLESFPSESEL